MPMRSWPRGPFSAGVICASADDRRAGDDYLALDLDRHSMGPGDRQLLPDLACCDGAAMTKRRSQPHTLIISGGPWRWSLNPKDILFFCVLPASSCPPAVAPQAALIAIWAWSTYHSGHHARSLRCRPISIGQADILPSFFRWPWAGVVRHGLPAGDDPLSNIKTFDIAAGEKRPTRLRAYEPAYSPDLR